ncbi:MAG TPA: ribosome recycling factor [Tissierellia bacterium]|jgi:ribosome recycling factor|nr:ribosome recycling factor [Tissierellia bacterium]
MSNQALDNLEVQIAKAISFLQREMQSVRAGRANPSLLDRIRVDYYGTETPLNQMANISAPEARLLTVQPYDKSMMAAIEKAIQTSDLGINPSNDGKVIRLSIPMLTEENRRELTKLIKKMGEEAKITVRNDRRNANDVLKKDLKDSVLREDEAKRLEEEVQDAIDEAIKKIDSLVEAKISEIMEV